MKINIDFTTLRHFSKFISSEYDKAKIRRLIWRDQVTHGKCLSEISGTNYILRPKSLESRGCPSHYIQEARETFQNVFEHATICDFAGKGPFEYSSDYYVVLKDILYGFDSPLKAVENCYKVFHVAHARYPFECEDVFMILKI
ncbi:hypothetical protein Avbf_14644 [Armadillidium vulgare]|nr:hypothetical protein Avbf_14644 [Armadillidium vulgare]